MANNKSFRFDRRKNRVRYKIRKVSDRNRLSIFRSGRHIYAQIIDDSNSKTLISASSLEKDLYQKDKSNCNKNVAEKVANVLAKRAADIGIKQVVFDKGGYKYHGVIKAFADEARKNLKF